MAPSGLYARLCHAFLVFFSLLNFTLWLAALGETQQKVDALVSIEKFAIDE